MQKLHTTLAVLTFAGFTSLAICDECKPIGLDFSKKGTSQKTELPIQLYSPEELASMSLDLRIEGLPCKQTEGKTQLHMGKAINYRFDGDVEVEFKLGIDDGKPILITRTVSVTKLPKDKEKKSYVSLPVLEVKVVKLEKLVGDSATNIEEGKAKFLEASEALRKNTAAIEALEHEVALVPENQQPAYQDKLKQLRDERTVLFGLKRKYSESNAVLNKKSKLYAPELESTRKFVEALKVVQSNAKVSYKAYIRVNGDEKLVAESK